MLKKPHKLRVVLLGGGFCLLGALVVGRLAHLQIESHDAYSATAQGQQTSRVTLQAERGEILDRHGRPLATSTGTLSVYINPKFFKSPEATVDAREFSRRVAPYSSLDAATIERRVTGEAVAHLGRQLNPESAQKIADIIEESGVRGEGWWLHRESKRRYPRALAPHILGYCGTDGDGDNQGRAGVEYAYNKELGGKRVDARAARSGIRQVMEPVAQEDLLSARGNTLVLTIDPVVQETAEAAVAEAGESLEATGVGAVAMDVNTGEILAMASWPTYDNARFGEFTANEWRNRILTDPFETGSVVKLFTAAMLLDLGRVDLGTMVDCEGGSAHFGRRRITDAPGHAPLHVVPFLEVIRYSSNVGTVKAAQVLENQEWYDFLRRFGLGQKSGIDLPGEDAGILYPTEKWTSYSRTSLPMGYEVSLTPMQIVAGVAGLVNGGELLQPYVVREVRDARGNVVSKRERTVRSRMIRQSTSLLMREIMEDVVLHGTGENAQVPGYRVGGKTGTTQKSHVLDHREYIASFAGAIPIDDPRVAIYCYVDNPPRGKHYGGQAAAPIFHKIATEAMRQLGVPPTEPVEGQTVDTVLDMLRTAPPDVVTTQGSSMPDLTGLTMAEARDALRPLADRVQFRGTGRAADQSPLPGAPVGPETGVTVIFDPDAPRRAAIVAPGSVSIAMEMAP